MAVILISGLPLLLLSVVLYSLMNFEMMEPVLKVSRPADVGTKPECVWVSLAEELPSSLCSSSRAVVRGLSSCDLLESVSAIECYEPC